MAVLPHRHSSWGYMSFGNLKSLGSGGLLAVCEQVTQEPLSMRASSRWGYDSLGNHFPKDRRNWR